MEDTSKKIDLTGIPFDYRDISFKQEQVFRANEQLYFNKRMGDITDASNDLIDALSPITGIDKEHLMDDFFFDIDDGELDINYIIREGDDLSIVRLYYHIHNVINTYTPTPITEFTYKDEVYKINNNAFNSAMFGENQLTTGEAVEVLELRHRFQQAYEIYEKNMKRKEAIATGERVDPMDAIVDPEEERYDGAFMQSMRWQFGLKELAILSKKEGERLPFSHPVREKFIEDRAREFEDIPASVVADVRFFLTCSLENYVKTATTQAFGKGGPKLSVSAKKPKIVFRQNQT